MTWYLRNLMNLRHFSRDRKPGIDFSQKIFFSNDNALKFCEINIFIKKLNT